MTSQYGFSYTTTQEEWENVLVSLTTAANIESTQTQGDDDDVNYAFLIENISRCISYEHGSRHSLVKVQLLNEGEKEWIETEINWGGEQARIDSELNAGYARDR